MDNSELLKRITVRADVFGGKPIIRNMRFSVETILSLLAQGASAEEILDDYPQLEEDDVRACIAYAHGQLVVSVLNRPGAELDDLLARVTEENLHREVETDPAVGAEAW